MNYGLTIWSLLTWLLLATTTQAEVLVTVGAHAVTSEQLEKSLQSSPFATQFPALAEDEQARLRGDLLQRLVYFEALLLEAERLGLDKTAEIKAELEGFEMGLLAQRYLQQLRQKIQVPKLLERQWRQQFGDNLDALAAARSLYVARQYQSRKAEAMANLERRLGKQGETQLWAQAAREAGLDVIGQVAGYRREMLVANLIQRQERRWIPDESVLRDYYQNHPAIGHIPERRRIGQIVVAEKDLAERLRRQIAKGESLFKLAKEYSIDPYGRSHAGDMGWLQKGSGMAEIEKVLATLPDNTVSEVIQTAKGYHLVMIVDRKPGEQKPFAAVKDRVRRAYLAERMPAFLEQVLQRYPLQWHLPEHVTAN